MDEPDKNDDLALTRSGRVMDAVYWLAWTGVAGLAVWMVMALAGQPSSDE